MQYKNPESVLVVIYAKSSGNVLMLQRKDDPDFWQSVTGSLAIGETPRQTAIREVFEETGLKTTTLFDCNTQVKFEIFPHFRYKYAPNVTHCLEHWFLLPVEGESAVNLTEHLKYQWLPPRNAAALTKSPNNASAIRQFILKEEI
ncbi:dihydroneopterin triphosphate pyrophosphatase [Cricetibacter osteomyelitidis]|uniref:Dihydroneopterin triphosphate pyrophosphatase n=1 Tax=Cricetibacter osteomyelitidis TaxID=1521931 RepID=A0A4R2T1G7_9PAST|nr:dihydroneopterin triphosphate diphosphatase [Cricetibacter osteomyelitidis]TCP95970.1 dihydroneopterin triphosphate pyrophosphatase [Cricetibacter osteomyelitidis]